MELQQAPTPKILCIHPRASSQAVAEAIVSGAMDYVHSLPVLPGSAARRSLDYPSASQQHLLYPYAYLPNPNPGPIQPQHGTEPNPRNAPDAAAASPSPSSPTQVLWPGSFSISLTGTGEQQQQQQPQPGGGGGAPRARRNDRASVDAALGAEMLATRLVSPSMGGKQLQQAHVSCFGASAITAPSVSSVAPPVPQCLDWDFGEDMQRVRVQARYAAAFMVDQVLYTPLRDSVGGGSNDNEGGDGSGGGAKLHWVSRLLSALSPRGASSRVICDGGGAAAATASRPGGRPAGQQSFVVRLLFGSRGHTAGGEDDHDEPMRVVASRDSRIVHRVRLGLDGRPQNQRLNVLAAVRPQSGLYDVDSVDEVNAAVVAAAAAFSAATSATPAASFAMTAFTRGTSAAPAAATSPAALPAWQRAVLRQPSAVGATTPSSGALLSYSSALRSSGKQPEADVDQQQQQLMHFSSIGHIRTRLLAAASAPSAEPQQKGPLPFSAELYRLESQPLSVQETSCLSEPILLLPAAAAAAANGEATA